MVTRHRVEWHGDEVWREVNTLLAVVEKDSADKVVKEAKRLFRANYGKYSWTGDSIKTIEVVKSKYTNGGYLIVAGGGEQYHMTFLELGADNLTAKPFLRPALNSHKKEFLDSIWDTLK